MFLPLKSQVSSRVYLKPVFSLPLTLDPVLINDGASQTVANQIYDGLIRISERMNLEPAIAESWVTSSDGLTITFRLRRNAKFHDESQVTASDVVFSLGRAIDESDRRKTLRIHCTRFIWETESDRG